MSFHSRSLSHSQRVLHLLNVSTKCRSLERTKVLHGLIIVSRPSLVQPIYLHNNLISLYASLGEVSLARKVFDQMPDRNIVSFNAMIGAYARFRNAAKAWSFFSKLRASGFRPTQHTLAGLLTCESLHINGAAQLHALSLREGLFSADVFVGTTLLGLYGRLGLLDLAAWVFEDMPFKNLVTWNSMMSLLGQHGFVEDSVSLFCELVRMQASLSECSVSGVLSGLSSEHDLEMGEQIHGLVVKYGFDFEVSVLNSLINMYAKCDSLHLAVQMLKEASFVDTASWNTIIDVMAKGDNPMKALQYFVKMLVDGQFPSQATFTSVMTACAHIRIFELGRPVHAMIIKNGFESDVFVGTSLVEYYMRCNGLDDARFCFDDIHEKNVASWNALISGYAENCCLSSASLFLQMLRLGFEPNGITFVSALKFSSVLKPNQLHSMIIKQGSEGNEYVISSLMTSYARNGFLSDALLLVDDSGAPTTAILLNTVAGLYNRSSQYHESVKLLSTLEQPDIVSWNIVIAACARSGNYIEVFELFKNMRGIARVAPDKYTFVSLINASAKLCNFALGCSVHGVILKTDPNLCDTFVCNVLIDMYAKCGSVASSAKIFEETREKNLITWTALISALGSHGYAHEALERWNEMTTLGLKPDRIAFLSILSACGHGGLVTEGMELFYNMGPTYGELPGMDHYHCIVDLLSRHGHLREAEKLIATMPFPPDALMWRVFLEGCRRFQRNRAFIC